MDDRLDWFPCEPSKLLQALSAMKPTVGYVYWIICLRIYELGGPCPDTLDVIARRTGYNRRIVSDALDTLFRAGKLTRTPEGTMNPYAEQVLGEIRARRASNKIAGQVGGLARAKNRQQKQSPPLASATYKETKNKASEEATASSASVDLFETAPAEPVFTDARHQLWHDGVAIMGQLGLKESKARPMIGRWLRDAKDDAEHVLSAIRRAREQRVMDPIPWITRAISMPPRIVEKKITFYDVARGDFHATEPPGDESEPTASRSTARR